MFYLEMPYASDLETGFCWSNGAKTLPLRRASIESNLRHLRRCLPCGIEAQRVNVIIDLTDPSESRPSLGDSFRVEAAIVEWESADVLTVPGGALFLVGDQWAVFVVVQDCARMVRVKLGHRNDNDAEVVQGLKEGDRVILYLKKVFPFPSVR